MYTAFNEGRVRPTQPRSPETTTPTDLEHWSVEFARAFGA